MVCLTKSLSGRNLTASLRTLKDLLDQGSPPLMIFSMITREIRFLLQAKLQKVGVDRLMAYAPWTLLFVFSNAFMEELHFRGLLLKPCERLLGPHSANVCIALFFTLTHAPVQYTPDILGFLAMLFVLALAWGYVIQKTEALWGAVLFHAGADLQNS